MSEDEPIRVGIAKQTWSRELRAMGYRKLSARPRRHAQADGAIEDFKRAFSMSDISPAPIAPQRATRPSAGRIRCWRTSRTAC
jgi:Winged helix-turn helix